MTDWIGDPNLSVDEKLARFKMLKPKPTRGPSKQKADVEDILMPMAVTTFKAMPYTGQIAQVTAGKKLHLASTEASFRAGDTTLTR